MDARKTFSVSVWSRLESRWVPYPGLHDSAKIAQLESLGWRLEARPAEVVENHATRLKEIDRMLSDVQVSRAMPASQRLVFRKALIARRAQLLGVQP